MTANRAGLGDGIGFALGAPMDSVPGVELCGTDLDGCRDPETGEIEDWAQKIIEELSSYMELSPSGEGVHILAWCHLPNGRTNNDIEMYAQGRSSRSQAGTSRGRRER
ncbi:MAG: hypothetical protein GEU90_14710 [Gemmatimonas sp.]|nr:hypothetical protein [Gemmatimonas sp.]